MAFNPVGVVEEEKQEEQPQFVPSGEVANSIDPWARSLYQTLGGAVAGYFTGGSPAGIGFGSSIAGQYWDLSQEIMGKKKPEPLLERSIGAAEDVMLDVISPVALQAGLYGFKKVGHAIIKKPFQKLMRPKQMAKYQYFGVHPSAATATQSSALIRIENALSDYFFSASPLISKAKRNVDALEFASKYLAREYGDVLTKEEVGMLLKKAVPGARKRLDLVYEKLFSRISKDIGPGTQHVVNTRSTLMKLLEEQRLGPKSGIPDLATEIHKKAEMMGGGLPFDALKKYRSKVGELMKSPFLISTRNIQSGDLKRLYAALSTDMEIAALRSGPKTHAKWRAANKYFDISLDKQVPILEEVLKKGYDQEAYRIVMQGAELGGGRLNALRRQLSQKEWDTVAGTVLGKLGKALPSQATKDVTFSLQTFLTNWNKISSGAKKQLFGYGPHKKLAKELDKLTGVMGDFREVEKLANRSKTGSVLMFFSVLSLAGGLVGGITGGEGKRLESFLKGAGAMGTMSLLPRQTAKLLTNDKFVRWLATGVKVAKTNPNAMKIHLGRLFNIRASENIKPEINELMKVISTVEE